MKITLCGSARFESKFKEANEKLTLAGHIVYSLAVYPSDKGMKSWYTQQEKLALDRAHFGKIENSDAIFLVEPSYTGASTTNEIAYAKMLGKTVFTSFDEVLPIPTSKP